MAMQPSRHAGGDQDLVLPYPSTGNRFAQNVFVVVFFGVLMCGPMIGLYAWAQTDGCNPAACWPVLMWFGGLAAGGAYMLVRAIVNIVVTSRRRARGDGWLHLSHQGFELHPRAGRYSPEHRRTVADRVRYVLAPRGREAITGESVNRARKLGIGGRVHSRPATVGPS